MRSKNNAFINNKITERQTLGFSTKTTIGEIATLFNAGKGTNFIYNITFPSNTHFDMEAFNRETYKKNMAPRLSSAACSRLNFIKTC